MQLNIKLCDQVLENIPGVLFRFLVDADGNTSIPFASKGFEDIFNTPASRFRSNAKLAISRIHPVDYLTVIKDRLFFKKNQKSVNTILRVKTLKNGPIKWIKVIAKPEFVENSKVLWWGQLYDISSSIMKDKELKLSKERLEFALENSKQGYWDWNVETNSSFYSDRSINMLGYTADEFINHADSWNEKVHPEDVNSYFEDMKNHLAGNNDIYYNQHRVLCKNGEYKWVLDRGKVVQRDDAGNPIRVIGTHQDIDHEKEKELNDQKANDVILDQNSRLLNFAYIVSHNLKSHAGNLEMMLNIISGMKTPEEKVEYVEHLNSISTSLNDTIANITELVSIQTKSKNEREKVNLRQIANSTILMLKANVDLSGAVIHNLIEEDVFVDYIPAYMESILLNLITNAIKYRHADRKPEIVLSTFFKGNHLDLKVSDNGIGMDLNVVGDRLFGMNQTFHGNKDARGIGLYITKNQIEVMGGTIEVSSTPNEGSLFTVKLR
jgi:PAS domain S-box-containing protein